jgi:alpha-glucosidase
VAVESRDPHSILEFYRRLLALRHQDEALREGDYVDLKPNNEALLAYLRRSGKEAVLVVLNMSGNEQTVGLGLAGHRTTLLCTPGAPHFTGSSVTLQPFAVYIARLSR